MFDTNKGFFNMKKEIKQHFSQVIRIFLNMKMEIKNNFYNKKGFVFTTYQGVFIAYQDLRIINDR